MSQPSIWLSVIQHIGRNLSVQRSSTGDLSEYENLTWSQHTLLFTVHNSSVTLAMATVGREEVGRDLAIDDIELRVCSNVSTGYCPSG